MPYVHTPKRTPSTFSGVSTGGPSITQNYGVRAAAGRGLRGTPVLQGMTPQQQSAVPTSQGRGAPERWEADLMGGIQTAVMAPAHTLERPLSIADTAARAAFGTPEGQPGPLKNVLDWVGSIGVGDFTLGNLIGAVGEGVMRIGDAPIAAINSKDARMLQKYWDAPDDQEMDEFFDYNVDGPPILGIFGIGGRNMTVGEFKSQLRSRGFWEEVNYQDGTITELTDSDVRAKVESNPFGFGDARVNESALVDIAARIGFDPFNLLFAAGVFGKAGQIARWATRPAAGAARFAGSKLRPAWGNGYLNDMARAGVRSTRFPNPSRSAQQILAGDMTGATLRGLGKVLAVPRALILPGKGSIPRRYARGALRTELTLLGVEVGSGVIDASASAALGEDNIVSGFMETIHDASQALLADKPMSENITFMMASAFAMPAVPLLREDIGAVSRGARKRLGDPDLILWSEKFGVDESGIKTRQDPTGRKRGKAKQENLLNRVGGDEGFRKLLWHIDMRIAFNRLKAYDPLIRHFESFDEAMARSRAVGHFIATEARRMREAGDIKSRQRISEFEEWGRSHRRTLIDKDGRIVRDVPERVDFELSPEALIDQWLQYQRVGAELGRRFTPVGEAIVGRARRLTQEDIGAVKAAVQSATRNGKIDAQYLRDLMLDYPATFEDASISPAQREFWTQTMSLASSDSLYGGGKLDVAVVQQHLDSLLTDAPAARDLFHEAAAAERRAPVDPSRQRSGPVQNGRLRKIYSIKKLREMRTKTNGIVRDLQKKHDAAKIAFDRKWTKKGNLRAAERRTRVPAKPEQSPFTPADDVRAVARQYNEANGLPSLREGEYWPLDRDFARRTGDAYESLPNVDEAARPAYEAFERETLAQYEMLRDAGYVMEPWNAKAHGGKEQPYNTSAEMQADVRENKHLWFFTGGEPHPFLANPLREYNGWTANDIFRAVHDIMTHAQEGYQFGARGEVNAAVKHAQMYSPLARRAMLTETHGQNSWTNFGPHDPQSLPAPDRPYAKQKAALLPDDIIAEFEHRYLGVPISSEAKALAARLKQAEKDLLAVERQADLDEMAGLREEIRNRRREVREINQRADEIRTVRIDPSFLDENGNPMVDPDSLIAIREQTAFVQDNFPHNYGIEKAPKVSWARYQPEDSHIAALLTERSNFAQVVFDYGPLSKMGQFVNWLTEPVSASKLAHDSRQQVFNRLMPLGAKTAEVSDFLNRLRGTQDEGWTVTKMQMPLFRGTTSIPPNRIQVIAREVFGQNETFIKNFEKKYGGIDRMHVALDEAYNSLVRKIDKRTLRGQKNGALARIFRSGYWAWQNLPGLRTVSDSTRMLSKVWYPLFRFQMDARWQALNVIEADIMAFLRDGIDGTRFSRQKDNVVRRGGRDVNISQRALDFHGTQSGMPMVGKKILGREGAFEDTGIFLTNQNLAPVLRRSFDIHRSESISKVINEMADTDPMIQTLRRKYGDEKGTWAEQLDETLYSFDRYGVRKTIDEAVRKVRKYEKWSQAEYDQMVPLINKLIERNQQAFDDLVQIHVGNINRSRIERTLNSYWLYWPISYQIKATKWMAGVLTNRAFGSQTNLGGAWTLNRFAENMNARMQSENFAEEMANNEDWWFTASMLMPITPWDMGVSLNRGVRYVGGNVLGLWPEYAGLENPADFGIKMAELGPIYTARLASRLFAPNTQDRDRSGPSASSLAP